MTAPAYTTDLATVHLAETGGGTWLPATATGWTATGSVVNETDYFIQGVSCSSRNMKTGVGACMTPLVSNFTVPTDGAILVWLKCDAPNCLAAEASGGIRLMIGNTQAVFYGFKLLGSDTYPYGGWSCLACTPAVTPDYTLGAPASPWQIAGAAVNMPTAYPAKGNPFGVDAIRVGRCEARFAYGDANGYATFAGFAAVNDANTAGNYNRWGLLQSIAGGYLWQGLMVLGYANAVDFRDANASIVVANTKKVTANFNTIEIRQAGSRVDMTSVSISALGTVSRGRWITTDNADVNLAACTFTDMATFGFLSNTTCLDCIFRRTDQITTGGAVLTGCTIDNNRASSAVLVSSPANAELISGCSFTSDGTGHGLEIGGSAANMELVNCSWSGYAGSDGSSGNEAIFVNIAGGSMNLTITGGTTPSIRTAGCAVTVISSAVSATVNVKTPAGGNLENARVLLKAADGTGPFPYNVTVTISNSGTTATVSHTGHAMATNDKIQIKGASHWQNNGCFTITKINDNSYSYTMPSAPGSDPTGTIKATFVALEGLTNVNGQITMSRVFPSDQPVIGWARKSSSQPFYKSGVISGVIDSGTGFSATVSMVPDE